MNEITKSTIGCKVYTLKDILSKVHLSINPTILICAILTEVTVEGSSIACTYLSKTSPTSTWQFLISWP
jgi:hypothetical protein